LLVCSWLHLLKIRSLRDTWSNSNCKYPGSERPLERRTRLEAALKLKPSSEISEVMPPTVD